MATKTFEELRQLAIQIRDEKTNKQNTATRVGTAMLEHINKLEQDYYDKTKTDEELKERDDKLTELERDTVNNTVLCAIMSDKFNYLTFGETFTSSGTNLSANNSAATIPQNATIHKIVAMVRNEANSFSFNLQSGGQQFKTFSFDTCVAGKINIFDVNYTTDRECTIFVNSPCTADTGGTEIIGGENAAYYLLYSEKDIIKELQDNVNEINNNTIFNIENVDCINESIKMKLFGNRFTSIGTNLSANISKYVIPQNSLIKKIIVLLRSSASNFSFVLKNASGETDLKSFSYDNVIAGKINVFDVDYTTGQDVKLFVNTPCVATEGGTELVDGNKAAYYLIYERIKDLDGDTLKIGSEFKSEQQNLSTNLTKDIIPAGYDLKCKIVCFPRLNESVYGVNLQNVINGSVVKELTFNVYNPNGINEFYFEYKTTSPIRFFPLKPCIATEGGTELVDGNKAALYIEYVQPLKDEITSWGNSLTMGAGGKVKRYMDSVKTILQNKGLNALPCDDEQVTYSSILQGFLEQTHIVNNAGIGGETINTIAARMGAIPALLPKECTLQNGVDVAITDSDNKLKNSFGDLVKPLLQGSDYTVNPCYIQGYECKMKYADNNYTLSLVNITRNVTIPANTPIIMSGSKIYRDTDIAIIWAYTNGGYSDDEDLIKKLNLMIKSLNTRKYIIIGVHIGDRESRQAQELRLLQEYGDKFFNWREYVSTQALYDFGITPTTDDDLTEEQKQNGVKSDAYQMSIGALPSSFWAQVYGIEGNTSNDTTHITADCYAILAYKLYEICNYLGYVE